MGKQTQLVCMCVCVCVLCVVYISLNLSLSYLFFISTSFFFPLLRPMLSSVRVCTSTTVRAASLQRPLLLNLTVSSTPRTNFVRHCSNMGDKPKDVYGMHVMNNEREGGKQHIVRN